jgi:hypothetical protein
MDPQNTPARAAAAPSLKPENRRQYPEDWAGFGVACDFCVRCGAGAPARFSGLTGSRIKRWARV